MVTLHFVHRAAPSENKTIKIIVVKFNFVANLYYLKDIQNQCNVVD